uniref:NELL2-interacting cell ontogeny regulator 1 n=1 Tax=Felis catus TaxID=9685 RepID=A0ABI7Z751_FELCA
QLLPGLRTRSLGPSAVPLNWWFAQSRGSHDNDGGRGTRAGSGRSACAVRARRGTSSRVARAAVAGSLNRGRPCVDCHAFEFMQRALQDLRKTAYSLDSRTETLLLQAERRALCACWPAGR